MFLLAAGWVLESAENIGTVNFRRDLDFRREFVFLAAKRVVGVFVTLTAALAFRTYWALIVGTLVGRAVGVVLSYLMLSYRPRFSILAWREVMGFSGWLFVSNVLTFVSTRLSHFVIGRTLGPGPLGIFTLASDIAALASSEITMPINRAVLPGLSRMNEHEGGLSRGLLQVTSAISLISMPASFGLAAIAEPLVLTLLGSRWIEAVPAVQVLAFAGALQSVTASNHSAYLASARSYVPVMTLTAMAVVLIGLLFALRSQGLVGVAFAHLGATGAAVCVSLALMRRFLGVKLGELLKAVVRPVMAAAVMSATVAALDALHFGLAEAPQPALRLVFGLIVGASVYALVLAALWCLVGRPLSVEAEIAKRIRRVLA
jgi:O-antigen/teichoic acid export membrane protein